MSITFNIDPANGIAQKAALLSLRAEPQRGKRSNLFFLFLLIFADCFGIKRLAMTFPFLFAHPLLRES
jgi:hypothetical protein